MRYLSTRGQASVETGAEAIKLGLAPDGGLFLPERIPALSATGFMGLSDLTYAQMAARVLEVYLPDYSLAELQAQAEAAYGPDRFDDPEVTPMHRLDAQTHVLELWHGPTAAFKDLALQIMPRLLTAAIAKTGEQGEIVILVATSGDTGKAALEGFRDVPGTRIIVFYPRDGVSRVQELQMTTQEGSNTAVVAVKGNFDDAQTGIKAIFGDHALSTELAARNLRFSSANSINWGRLAPQIAYYIRAYLQLLRQGAVRQGEPVIAAVPTGNFGNILAAYYAKSMGVPFAKLVCASNQNKILTDFIRTGVYDRRRDFHVTSSPSMDILISSNLERLLFLLADMDPEPIRGWMAALEDRGTYTVGGAVLHKLQEIFWAGFADEERTRATIARAYHDGGYLLDTHTAVGLDVLESYRRETGDRTPAILAATASPFKFSGAVLRAVAGGEAVAGGDETSLLRKLADLTGQPIPPGLRRLDAKPIRHTRVCAREEMPREIKALLGLTS